MTWSWRRPAWGVALFSSLCSAALAQNTQLVVYTALEPEQVKAYAVGFAKVQPDIEIKWVRHPNGVITEKLLDERGSPQADAVMGRGGQQPRLARQAWPLAGVCADQSRFDHAAIPRQEESAGVVGHDVWGSAICFNTAEAARQKIPKPRAGKI